MNTKTIGAVLTAGLCMSSFCGNVLEIRDPDPGHDKTKTDCLIIRNYNFADRISSSVSLAVWAKDVSGTTKKHLVGITDHWEIAVDPDAVKMLTPAAVGGRINSGKYVLNDGQWHLLVATFNYDGSDPSKCRQVLYIDGVASGSLTTKGPIPEPGYAFTIGGGAYALNGSIYFNEDVCGRFAECAVWDVALTADEVAALNDRSVRLGSHAQGLIGYWRLTADLSNEATDYAFPDLSGAQGCGKLLECFSSPATSLHIASDDDMNLPYVAHPYARYIASPEWCASHGYVQGADATGRSWNDPLTNLNAAVKSAASYEWILCSPGTHVITEQMVPMVKNFRLGSCDPATGRSCPATAIVDACGQCRHVWSSNLSNRLPKIGEDSFLIDGLTFVNGAAPIGGSMGFCDRTGVVKNCIFRNNAATGAGSEGGAYLSHLSQHNVVSNCLFELNTAAFGGAVQAMMNGTTAEDYATFYDCTFRTNTATSAGGALNAPRNVHLYKCRFDGNTLNGVGEGGQLRAGNNAEIVGCAFTGANSAAKGNIIYFANGADDALVSNCTFTAGTAPGGEACIQFYGQMGKRFRMINCSMTNNVYASHLIRFESAQDQLFRQCLFADNGDVNVFFCRVTGIRAENCTFAGLTKEIADFSWSGSANCFVNCIIDGSAAGYSDNPNTLSNCFLRIASTGTRKSPFDGEIYMKGPIGFVDADNGNYMLGWKSKCREKGMLLDWMGEGSVDLSGRPRLVNRQGVPFAPDALPDLGCYEAFGVPPGFSLFLR